MESIKDLIYYAKQLKKEGLVSDGVNKGSISFRNDNNEIAISPSKLSYDELNENNTNIIDVDGKEINMPSPMSRDTYFHLQIYKAREDVNAIIHTHSKYALALALANKDIPFIIYGMKQHCKGKVDIAPFYFPNTPECNDAIIKHLEDRNAVLLQNHGLVCVGKTLKDCYETVVFVESLAESYIHAMQIGNVKDIDKWKEVNYG